MTRMLVWDDDLQHWQPVHLLDIKVGWTDESEAGDHSVPEFIPTIKEQPSMTIEAAQHSRAFELLAAHSSSDDRPSRWIAVPGDDTFVVRALVHNLRSSQVGARSLHDIQLQPQPLDGSLPDEAMDTLERVWTTSQPTGRRKQPSPFRKLAELACLPGMLAT